MLQIPFFYLGVEAQPIPETLELPTTPSFNEFLSATKPFVRSEKNPWWIEVEASEPLHHLFIHMIFH